ncbi:MAG: hypothetical protein QM760_02905 [Nibricoccus sp.]
MPPPLPASPAPAPAPSTPTPSTPPPRPRLSLKARLVLILGTVALVVAIAASLTWAHFRGRVPEAEFIAWLHTQSSTGLTIDKLAKTVTPQNDGSSLIKFDASGTLPAPLYVREDTASHLRNTLHLSPALDSVVREAAKSSANVRIRERAGLSDTPIDPLEAVVLRETTAAGTTAPLSGMATAARVDGQWRFALLKETLSSPSLEGQPRAAFGEKTYLIGNADDDAALKQLVEKQASDFTRLEKAAAEIAMENKRDRQSRITRFHERITPGTLFTGTSAAIAGGA